MIFSGYLIGSSECIEYIFYVATAAINLGHQMTEVFPHSLGYEPLIWLSFLVIANSIFIFSGQRFWTVNLILAALTIGVLILFCIGSLPFGDSTHMSDTHGRDKTGQHEWFSGGFLMFIKHLPTMCWFYIGIEVLNMTASNVDNPGKTIPKGVLHFLVINAVFAYFVFLIACSLADDGDEILSVSSNPLHRGM